MFKLSILATVALLFGGTTVTKSARQEFCSSPGLRIPPPASRGCCTVDEIRTDVPAYEAITDVEVTVNLDHTFLSDLEVFVSHVESQQAVVLMHQDCGQRDDVHVVFSDNAAETLRCRNRDEGLTYRPVTSLAVFDGIVSPTSTRWTWRIIINDAVTDDTGDLDSWCVSFVVAGARQEYCSSPGIAIPPDTIGCCTQDSITTNLPFAAVIRDVQMTVNLDHTWLGDIEVSLINEESQQSALVLENSCNLSDDIHVVFRDDASEALVCANRDQGLAYTPVQPLAVFDGMESGNAPWTWTISIDDESSGDIGQLDSWCISFEVEEAPVCRLGMDDLRAISEIASETKLLLMEAAVSGDSSQFDEFVGLNFLYDFRLESHVGSWESLAEYLDPITGTVAAIRSFGTVDSVIINSGANMVVRCHVDGYGRRNARVTFPTHAIYAYEEYTAEVDELRSVTWIEAEPGCWRAASSTLDQFSRQATAPTV